MRAHSLLYHDVVQSGDFDCSGFRNPIANRYKLDEEDFLSQLSAIADEVATPAVSVDDLLAGHESRLLLTFDDGGSSFLHPIADWLDERGWIGHFFITTDCLNTDGFLTESQLRELDDRGHVIGSHTVTHPKQITLLSEEDLRTEWQGSCDILSDMLGKPITTGSIPGGYYSDAVAEAAFDAGIKTLFTSEPTAKVQRSAAGTLIGRFSITRSTSLPEVTSLAAGNRMTLLKQSALWGTKKLAKRIMGPVYRKLSEQLWKARANNTEAPSAS